MAVVFAGKAEVAAGIPGSSPEVPEGDRPAGKPDAAGTLGLSIAAGVGRAYTATALPDTEAERAVQAGPLGEMLALLSSPSSIYQRSP
jgi:hypothetical protein